MGSNDLSGGSTRRSGTKQASGQGESAPEWASGLRQLYDSVVEEPVPNRFKDLLDKLDGTSMTTADGDT